MGSTHSKHNNNEIRRLALIFSHKTFQGRPTRDGNESEVEQLQATLSLFHFDVQVFQDESRSNVLNTVEHYARRDYNEYDCLVVIVLTHGDRGGVLWACDEEYNAKDVWGAFLHTSANIPKIFIFQACRGGREELTFQVSAETQAESKESQGISVPVLPHKPGFLLIHSTVEENVSKRDPKTGSIYIQSLCNRLQDKNLQNIDILTLLTNINCDVLKFEQTATFTSFLHQTVTIRPSIQEEPSTSQSSSLRNDARQGVVPQSTYPSGNGKIVTILLYTSIFERYSTEMSLVLQRLPGCVIALNVNMDETQDIETDLFSVATSRKIIYDNADSLLVVVHAEMIETEVTEYCEKISFKTRKSNNLPFNAIWRQFSAAQCQWLRGKPKLFFCCDVHRTDDAKGFVNACIPGEESINNTADFFWSFCYGLAVQRELLFVLERPEEEITQMMTTVMRKAESKMLGKLGRFSHMQSTLKYQFYFPRSYHLQYRLTTSTLLVAVEQGNVPEVQRWLTIPDVDVNIADAHGTTSLILACKNRNVEIVEILLATGKAKVNLLDQDGNGPLYWAARRGHLAICEILVKNGAAVNIRNRYKNTPIYWPAREGNLEVVKLLVENKADIRNKSKLGRQPIHWAASNGRLKVVAYLVEHGADIDCTSYENKSVLYEAAGLGRLESVRKFVELGANLDKKMLYVDMTALAVAAKWGRFNVVQYLIERGADVNTRNSDGNTPLHFARKFPDIFNLLLENGADERQTNNLGYLP